MALKIDMDPRYIIFVLPVYLVVVCKGLVNLKQKDVALFLILILILLESNVYFLYGNYSEPKEDWRSVSEFLKDNSLSNDLVITIPSYTTICLEYYGIDYTQVVGLGRDRHKNELYFDFGIDLASMINEMYPEKSRLWILYTLYAAKQDENKHLLKLLTKRCVKKFESYATQIYLYERN